MGDRYLALGGVTSKDFGNRCALRVRVGEETRWEWRELTLAEYQAALRGLNAAIRTPAPSPVVTEEEIARAIWDVGWRWIAPNFPGLPPRKFEQADERERELHLDYARAVLSLLRERRPAPVGDDR